MIGADDRHGHFTINSHDGYISVNSELDRGNGKFGLSVGLIPTKTAFKWSQRRNSNNVFINKIKNIALSASVY